MTVVTDRRRPTHANRWRTWTCPHGKRHLVHVLMTPATGHGELRQPGSIKVTAEIVCQWCVVDRRVVLK